MKIGVMTLSLRRGGAERITAMLAEYLGQRHDCRMILFDTATFDYPCREDILDLRLPEPGGRNPLARLKNTLRALPRIRRLKRRMNFHVLLSSLEPANIPNVLAGGSPQTRIVLWVHEDKSYVHVDDLQRKVSDYLIRKLYPRADRVIAVSRGIRKTLMEKYGLDGEKITVIYNPIDRERIRQSAAEPLPPEYQHLFAGPVITTMGRLTLQKGQWHLIRAFREVNRILPDTRLVILGDGELHHRLVSLTGDLGLKDRVFFLGYQSNPFQFLGRSSLFVLPSLWEGFGYVILESLSLGIPVVSTDCPSGPREILAPNSDIAQTASAPEWVECGVLVPPMTGQWLGIEEPLNTTETMLKDAILMTLADSETRGQAVRQGLARAEDFRKEIIFPRYEEALNF